MLRAGSASTLHRRRSHVPIVDEHGELTMSRIVNGREAFLELLGDPQGAETHVALETTYGWEWLAALLEEAGYDLHLAHRCERGRSPRRA